jgi:hypothetical protein
MKPTPFENFPLRLVAVSNAAGLSIYAIGLYLMAQLGPWWAVLYAAYCLWMEWRLLAGSCRFCYYYGKSCGFGKGQVCSMFFTKGTERSLSSKQITWLDIVPDLLVSLIPLLVGIALLIRSFSWLVLILVIALAFLGTAGTGFVRSQIVCKYCKQREIGCPAEQLFGKTTKAETR